MIHYEGTSIHILTTDNYIMLDQRMRFDRSPMGLWSEFCVYVRVTLRFNFAGVELFGTLVV